MSTEAPNVNSGETNNPELLSEQSGMPNMSSSKTFTVDTNMQVNGDLDVTGTVTATSFVGDGSQLTGISGGTGGGGLDSAAVTLLVDSDYVQERVTFDGYATLVGYNPTDPSDLTSIVLDAKDGISPATFRGDVINDSGSVIVDVSSPSATFTGALLGTVAGNSTTPDGAVVILDVGTDGTDGTLTITNITADGSVDFTGATVTGIPSGGLDSAAVQSLIDAEVQDPTTLILGTSSNAGVRLGSGATTSALSGGSVSIGTNANSYIQSVAIGSTSTASGTGSVAIGPNSGGTGNFITAVGRQATTSGSNSVALGYSADAGNFGIALGDATSGNQSIAIGALASATNDNALHINANYNSGVGPSANGELVIETSAARLEYSVASDWEFSATVNAPAFVGDGSGLTNLPSGGGLDSAAVTALVDSDYVGGRVPPVSSYRLSNYFSIPAVYAEVNDIAIGNGAQVADPSGGAGTMNSIAIGQSAETRGGSSISIGHNAITNANHCTVVGANAGNNAAQEMVSIGNYSNADTQSTSVGYDAGIGDGFSARNVALGYTAGKAGSTVNSVAIGNGAGSVGSGRNSSIAIGFLAGQTNQAANNIIVNATGSALNRTDQYGIDIRTSAAGSLTYDTTNDWTFGAGVTMTDLTASGVVIFSALPTSDPVNAGQLWNDAGTLKVSAG